MIEKMRVKVKKRERERRVKDVWVLWEGFKLWLLFVCLRRLLQRIFGL